MKTKYFVSLTVIVILNLLCLSTALGASGYVSGTIKHFNHLLNYCPNGADCYGAKYTYVSFDVARPIQKAKVTLNVVFNQGSGETVIQIGEGTTSSNGYYNFQWTINDNDWNNYMTNGSIQLRWNPVYRETINNTLTTRFAIKSSSGGNWFFWAPVSSLTNGTTYVSSQSLGTMQWGSAGSPNALTNLYEGATRMWTNISVSSRMQTYFTDVEIRAWLTTPNCQYSCAFGDTKMIYIDQEDSAYNPQARVAHEMGHIVSHLASESQSVKICAYDHSIYNYDDQTGSTWQLNSPENGCIQFEEGFATFLADTAFYMPNASSPMTCDYTTDCTYPLEPSTYNVSGSCAQDENRWALTVDRFLWDLYDANVDFTEETLHYLLSDLIEVISLFPNGTDDRQKNEPWNSNLTSVITPDGRSTHDYLFHLIFHFPSSPSGTTILSKFLAIYEANCTPVGS